MNDESPSAASASLPRPIRSPDNAAISRHERFQTITAESAARQKKKREVFNKKRGELLDDVLRNFDILIYAELSVIYYMDCAFFRFFIRAIVQLIFLTPKSGILPEPPANRPYIGAILGVNILCFILHAFTGVPAAGEATRGYLHGGLVMDFIGQKGPSSKTHLLLLDVLVLVLQVMHLSAHLLRQSLKKPAASARQLALFLETQSVDDEERGVRHSVEVQLRQEAEIESLNRIEREQADDVAEPLVEESQEAIALSEADSSPPNDAHILDAFNSGQIVLADLNLLQVLQEQLLAYQKSASQQALRDESRQLLSDRIASLRSLHWAR